RHAGRGHGPGRRRHRDRGPGPGGAHATRPTQAPARSTRPARPRGGDLMRRSLIFDTTVRLVFDAALVLSVYMLFAGHNQPGGGFVGGLVAAAAIALRYIAGGLVDALDVIPARPWLF